MRLNLISIAGGGTPRTTPYMVHHKNRVNIADNNDEDDSNHEPVHSSDIKQTQIGNHPRGINRLSSKTYSIYLMVLADSQGIILRVLQWLLIYCKMSPSPALFRRGRRSWEMILV